jgi:hypothetical protein
MIRYDLNLVQKHLLGLLIIIALPSHAQIHWYGQKQSIRVHVWQQEQTLVVERRDVFKGVRFLQLDTLSLEKSTFKGKHFRIRHVRNTNRLMPGNIKLVSAPPADSLFDERNREFIQSCASQLHQLDWTTVDAIEALQPLLDDSILIHTNPEYTYPQIKKRSQALADTALVNQWQYIDSIIIQKNRAFTKAKILRTINNRDSIHAFWNNLYPTDSIIPPPNWPEYAETIFLFAEYVGFGLLHPIFFLFPIPLAITNLLLAAAIWEIRSAYYSRQTYTIKCYRGTKGTVFEVRKNMIIHYYRYHLKHDVQAYLQQL